MATTDIIDIINFREVVRCATVVGIYPTTSALVTGQALHNSLLAFNNIFSLETISYVKLLGIELIERTTSTTPIKKALNVQLYRGTGITVTAGNEPTITTYTHRLPKTINIPNTGYESGKNTSGAERWAFTFVTINSYYVEKDSDVNLYFALLAGEPLTYASGTNLDVKLYYQQL